MRVSRFAAICFFVLSCTTPREPMVTLAPPAPLSGERTVFLTAVRQSARIGQSLREAGFKIVSDPRDADYSLRVDVGADRASHGCGTTNNVTYHLSLSGTLVTVIKARGLTGSCTPNVFDESSRKLAQQFSSRR